MNRIAILERLDRGEISTEEALLEMGGREGPAEPAAEPEATAIEAEDVETPAVSTEEEVRVMEVSAPVMTRRERRLEAARRLGAVDPQQLIGPAPGERPWPWAESGWQWIWQNAEHPLHVDRDIEMAAGGGLWCVVYDGDLQLTGAGEKLDMGAAAFDLRVGVDGEGVRIAGACGELELGAPETVKRIEAAALPGDIRLRRLHAQEIGIRCAGGDFRCAGVRAAGRLRAEIDGGTAILNEVEGALDVAVVRGGIEARRVRSHELSLRAEGGIKLHLERVDGGSFRCQTEDGDIEVELGAGSAFELDARSEAGVVIAAELSWSALAERSEQHLRGSVNGGGARIELVTRNGRIFIDEN